MERKVLSVKLGTVPAFIQLRYRYRLRPGRHVEYRTVVANRRGGWSPSGSWQYAMVEHDYPLPLLSRL